MLAALNNTSFRESSRTILSRFGQSARFDQRPEQDMGVEEQAQLRPLETIKDTVRKGSVKISWNSRAT